MKLWLFGCALALAAVGSSGLQAQRSASGVVAVRVDPEAHLQPSRAALQFVVPPDGKPGTLSQSLPVAAWVRALPGRRIRLTATAAGGTLPASALAWSGLRTHATGGAQTATCTSGTFAGNPETNLAVNWNRSGILTCTVTFFVTPAANLPPGVYTAEVNLGLRTE